MKPTYKEIKTLFTFPGGRTQTATFCVPIDAKGKEDGLILAAMGEYYQKQFALGALKAKTTTSFV
jgi:hypothetical protein